MKAKIVNLDNQVVGERVLDTNIFNLEPRVDIIKLVVDWQRAKKMAGTHSTKTVSEVSGTTRKPFKQKGTGNARQGSLRSVHMRGGGVIHGPVVRSHATKLPKKVRKLGLKHALSSKLAEGKLIILESLILENSKTASLVALLKNFQGKSFFVIDGNLVNNNFAFAVRNIPNISVVPQIGANVYDIISHDCILVSQAAVDALEERLK
ncbi:50S ribosomal protein L4 [Candidatus Trichorickettsia mobilis]|uniref:Large ribosomal subunit protein uL4 n=1 Tax=Candidatus Trichorickettsia mobilis TaxID=1346319 RepID=A0ABZ0UR78_9RICK|nr:50S ribosomal protein L4 [Candidatus Trichorickettsia mobilis]WPY00540.1 50S ribosomal protein L4 [Candidatus Trichorickettsia mobilis]